MSIPSVCNDPTLPKSAELRGVVPLIDPAVGGQDVENANSKTSITTPFDATGLSVAQVMVAQGFSNFTAVDAAGNKVDASTLSGGAATDASTGAASSAVSNSSVVAVSSVAAVSSAVSSTDCIPSTTMVTVCYSIIWNLDFSNIFRSQELQLPPAPIVLPLLPSQLKL